MLRASYCEGKRYLAFEELEEFPFLLHLFTTKQSGPALLPAARRTDSPTLLTLLRRGEPLVSLKQLHGNQIRWVGREQAGQVLDGDGLITDASGLLLATQTADCLPVLVIDPKKRVVANLHAGWRGTLCNIMAAGIQEMLSRGSDVRDLLVAFGPSIGSCCYEVGPELVAKFREKYSEGGSFFISRPERERKFLDLRKANYAQAIQLGLRPNQVLWNSYCTQCDSEMFFSYRREGARTGRMFALVGIQ